MLSHAVSSARLGVWRFHPADELITFSDQFAGHFGFPVGVQAVSYGKILSIIHPDDRMEVDNIKKMAQLDRDDFIAEFRVVWPDGSEHWIYGHGRPVYAHDGALEAFDGVTMDITHRKTVEIAYKTNLAMIEAAFESMDEAIIVADADQNMIAANKAVRSFFRFKEKDKIPRRFSEFSELFDITTIDDRPVIHPYLLALMGTRRSYEIKIRRKDTGETWYARTGTSPIRNEKNEIIGAASTGLDIASLKELQAGLEDKVRQRTAELTSANRLLNEISHHDVLTGLNNRLAGNERLRSEFERMKRTGETYCLLMADIDLFKKVNDTFGHAVGDEVLKLVSRTLSNNLREYDFLARWGGEEFLVLLPATGFNEASVVAEKLRSAVEGQTHPIAGAVTISAGFAVASPEELNEDLAVMRADEGLYEAKKSGRNRVVGKSIQPASAHPSISA